MKRVMIVAAISLGALLVGISVVLALTTGTRTPPFRNPDGSIVRGSVAEERFVTLGGFKQYTLRRGRDRAAPLLLLIHGGPGTPEMQLFRYYNASLENQFVVVNWDQRGAGKSYSARLDPATLTLDRFARDLDELVDLLLKEFGREKVLLVAHSWGTELGMEYVARHPGKVAAYVGIGQESDVAESEAQGYAWVLDQARASGDITAVRALQRIGPPPYSMSSTTLQRRYLWKYGGAFHDRRSFLDLVRAALRIPESSWPDLVRYELGQALSFRVMWPSALELNANTRYPSFDIPVFFFLGRFDHQVSASLAAEYFDRLKAPRKELTWFDQSAHSPPFEEPEKFNREILRIGRTTGMLTP
jgi:proline iminopeptidase